MKTYTVEEATMKWCPMARLVARGDSGEVMYNRPEIHDDRCMASECMWWQPDDGRGYCGLVKNGWR